jgi:CheY-like chemotaxis protein
MLQTGLIEDAAGAQWEQLMNDSGVPIIDVVDDDESVRESLAGLAESVGYEAALFASAEEFLQSARHRDSLACLILDVRLPGMSGVDLYTRLPLSLRSIPTIFITAHADREMNGWGHETRRDSRVVQTISTGGFAASRAKGDSTIT